MDNDDTTTTTTHHEASALLHNLTGGGGQTGASGSGSVSGVTALEQQVLDEYARLLGNMNHLSQTLSSLSSGPITLEIAEGLRLLERKVASVYTLMKASVYSIVLQQGQLDGDEDFLQEGADE